MSRLQSTRRLSLLAGSSLAAAGLSAAAGLALAPATALAANECGNPSANAAAADSLTCATPPTYTSGVDYSTTSNGDLTITLQNRFDTGTTATGGIRMFGKAGEDMTLIRQDSPAGSGDPRIVNTTGRAIDVTTLGDGNVSINLTDGDPTSEASTNATTGTAPIRITGSSDAIWAEAFGSGNVGVVFAPTGTPSGTNNPLAVITAGATAPGGSGIVARSVSGDINIDARAVSFSINTTNGQGGIDAATSAGGDIAISTGTVSGRRFGVRAAVTGAGTLTVNTTGAISASNTTGDAAMILTTGTGLLTVNAAGGLGSIGSSAAYTALRLNTGGNANLTLQDVTGNGLNGPAVHMTTATGTLTTITAARFGLTPIGLPRIDRVGVLAMGGNFNISATQLNGIVNFAGVGNLTLSVSQAWNTTGNNSFGAGDDLVTLGAGALFTSNTASVAPQTWGQADQTFDGPGDDGWLERAVVFNFGTGDDRFTNAGTIIILPRRLSTINFPAPYDWYEGELRFDGLERFDNSGDIWFGAYATGALERGLDRAHDDILILPGTTFTGLAGSLIRIDADLGLSQSGCSASLRDPVNFDMPAADCIGLPGGATAGVTLVNVTEAFIGDRGNYVPDGIVVVDVSGGTSASGRFILDPLTTSYDPQNGGTINKGAFIYPLLYDAATQQHKLVGLPSGNTMQYPLLAQAAHGLWRLSTGGWFERQADMRADGRAGGWMRVSTEFGERDAAQSYTYLDRTFTFDNSYEQSSYAVTGGVDVFSAGLGGGQLVLGASAGYAHSELVFDPSPNVARFDGFTGGGYASFAAGSFFVDAIVNANRLELEQEVPQLNLFPAGSMLGGNLVSVGVQVEAGWRLALGEDVYAQPLASLSYVRSKWDDLHIDAADSSRPGADIGFDDPTSLRGGIGGRLGLDQDYGVLSAQYALLGRVWSEFEDETAILFPGSGSADTLAEDAGGSFSELTLSAGLSGLDGAVAGFLQVGGRWGDDYEAQTASAGVRVAW